MARGTSEGELFAWNTNIVIYVGMGKHYPMHEGTGLPRVLNGLLRYRVADNVPTLVSTDGLTSRPTTEERTIARIVVPPPEVDATSFRLRLLGGGIFLAGGQ